MVQVHAQPPYTQVCVCVCVSMDRCAHTYMNWDERALSHTHKHGHTATQAPATSIQTHTYGTYNHTYKWEQTVMLKKKNHAHMCVLHKDKHVRTNGDTDMCTSVDMWTRANISNKHKHTRLHTLFGTLGHACGTFMHRRITKYVCISTMHIFYSCAHFLN
jgi:hypothetical protein